MEEIILEEESQQSMEFLVDLRLQGSWWTTEVSEVIAQYLWPHRDKLLCDILLMCADDPVPKNSELINYIGKSPLHSL